ncbi:sodium:solute symporter family transporter [Clostridium sp.]|jgi:solute:Na+ symporter, SSS family|uniref:sodium:solute symporter family transporter n=1 Tax=Clostridium sp. TaxID=1506 RepID=UPI003A5C6CED
MDIFIVIVYFTFLILIGLFFRKFTSSTSDYFRGSGKMLWWMVGATAFMTQFSAWSFTGAAGKAFTDGLAVLIIFLGNAIGYFGNYLFFAEKARQMRVVTPMEGIRLRYGKLNEQVFTWATVPSSILSSGIALNALAIFVSAVTNIPMSTTIIVTGIIVILIAVSGGSWAIISSNFLQMVIVMSVSIIASIIAIWKSGGVVPLFQKGLPPMPIAGHDINYMFLFVAWTLAVFAKQFFSTNSITTSYRYISAKDSKNAKKAALLACILMLIGPVIWFIPDWFVAGNFPNPSTWGLNTLGKNIKDATYFVFVRNELPNGMVGLMLAAMFASTMPSMDTGLNTNTGIFVRSFYKAIINTTANEKRLMIVSKISTLVFGSLIIFSGLLLNSMQNTSLFNKMMMVGTLVTFPVLIPSLLGFFVKKTPDWAGWGTILVGACVSYFVAFIANPQMIQHLLGLPNPLTDREWGDMHSMTLPIILHLTITLPFYLISQLFYKGYSEEREKEVNLFFNNVSTKVIADHENEVATDNHQRKILGKLIIVVGICIFTLTLIPNNLSGRLIFVAVSAIVSLIGIVLVKSIPKDKTTVTQK